jgi:hypothetical protein
MAKKNTQSSPLAAILLVAALCIFAGIAYSKAQDARALDVPVTIPESSTQFTDITDWMYYDDFAKALAAGEVDVSNSLTPETLVYSNVTDATPEMLNLAEEVKTRLRERFGTYADLNWSRFEATAVKECDFSSLSYSVQASYDAKTNTMYCVRNPSLNQDVSLLRLILAHEYIHALSSASDNYNSALSEGEVEYFAHQAYDCDDIAYLPGYAFTEAFVAKYGETLAISAFINDSLAAKISQDLNRENAMQNIDILLNDASGAAINKRVVLDVYCHYVDAIGVQDSVQTTTARLLGELDSMYENRRAKAYYDSIFQ